MLVVFEGIDGCGKGVQIEMLREKTGCKVFKYPTAKNTELNAFLNREIEMEGREVFNLFLKDIMNEQAEVKKSLAENKLVVLDRYVLSTIAYEKEGVSYEEAKKIVNGMGFLKPDMVVFIDIPPETAMERKRKQKSLDRYEGDGGYLVRARENFLSLRNERFLTPNWHTIEGGQSISDVHRQIMKLLKI